MFKDTVSAPTQLLLDPALSVPAKLVWLVGKMHAKHGAVRPTQLAAATGLSRTTVVKGLSQLQAAGWTRFESPSPTTFVRFPRALLVDPRVRYRGKVLYGLLQLTAGYRDGAGRFTYAGLMALMPCRPFTLRGAMQDLVNAKWVEVTRSARQAPVLFTLVNPVAAHVRLHTAQARRRLKRAKYLGEALMCEYLSLLIHSKEYTDGGDFGFLTNLFTGEKLELDRWYHAGLGFEFQGPHHFTAIGDYTEDEVARQQVRDYMKVTMCRARGMEVIPVQAEDLSLDGMRRIVGNRLPLRDLAGWEPLIDLLEAYSREYWAISRRWATPASARA